MKSIEGLQQTFEELKMALQTCSTDAIDRIISDAYYGYSIHGTVETKGDILENFKPGLISITEYSVENAEYELSGDIGIISGKGRISGSFNEMTFTHDVLFTDIFKYIAGSWKYYRSQLTEIRSV